MIKSTTSVVCDAGPIIHLDELGYLNIISDFKRVIVPEIVYDEVQKNRPGALIETSQVKWIRISQIDSIEKSLKIICRTFSLDAGETEALAILKMEPSCIFLTDDAAARLVAEKLGFKVHGTIGILIRAIRRSLMEPQQVVDILNRLPSSSSLYIRPSLLEEAVSSIKKRYNL